MKLFYCHEEGSAHGEFFVIIAVNKNEAYGKLVNLTFNRGQLDIHWSKINQDIIANKWEFREIEDGIFEGEWD